MIRILRLKKNVLSSEAEPYVAHSVLWREEITAQLGTEVASLLPEVDFDEEYVNFLTPLEGAIEEVQEEQLTEPLKSLVQRRKLQLLSFLNSDKPLTNLTLQPDRARVTSLFARSRRLFLMDRCNPVLLPCLTEEEIRSALPPPPVKSGQTGCLLPALLLLLLLLLSLGSIWWFLLRPWPMEGTLRDRFESLYQTYFKADTHAQEEQLRQIKELALELIKEQKAEEARKQALAEEQAAREASARKQEEEARLAEALKAKEEAEKARLEALEQQKKAEAEAKRLQEEQQKLKQPKEVVPKTQVKSPEPQKAEAKKAEPQNSTEKALPKCTTLKQQGKLPKMVVAFDGSESMLARDVNSGRGRQSRLEVATSAANNMVKSIDKNVQIGLVEINGCSKAKDRGFFSGSQRSALMGTIRNINPLRYDGKTPLVDGLNKLANMVDGVNAEAVGVLISDGEDTCDFTQNIDICSLARKIHAKKPKLKIHTILIGKNASKAACVARITGGKVFSPSNASQINAQLAEAGAEYKQVCKD